MTETQWPIDRFNPTTGNGYRQRVLVEAEVFDEPDPECDEPDDRFYVLAIDTGFENRELVSIRESYVREVVRRMPEPPAEPTMVYADQLAGFEVELFGGWYSVETVIDSGDGSVTINLHCESMSVTLNGGDLIPARLPEE